MPTHRSQSRSPAVGYTPLQTTSPAFGSRTPTFQPPAFYAAAAGVSAHASTKGHIKVAEDPLQYAKNTPSVPLSYPVEQPSGRAKGGALGSGAMLVGPSRNRSSSLSRSLSRAKGGRNDRDREGTEKLDRARCSQLVELETQLLPSLRDTIDRMTHPTQSSSKPYPEDVHNNTTQAYLPNPSQKQTPYSPGPTATPRIGYTNHSNASAPYEWSRQTKPAESPDPRGREHLEPRRDQEVSPEFEHATLRPPATKTRLPSPQVGGPSRRAWHEITDEGILRRETPEALSADHPPSQRRSPRQEETRVTRRDEPFQDDASSKPRKYTRSPNATPRHAPLSPNYSPQVAGRNVARSGIPRPNHSNGSSYDRAGPSGRAANDTETASSSEEEAVNYRVAENRTPRSDRSPYLDRSGSSKVNMRLPSAAIQNGQLRSPQAHRNVGLGFDVVTQHHGDEYSCYSETSEDDSIDCAVLAHDNRDYPRSTHSQPNTPGRSREQSADRRRHDALAGIVDGLGTQFTWYQPVPGRSRLSEGDSEANTSGVGLAIGEAEDLHRGSRSPRRGHANSRADSETHRSRPHERTDDVVPGRDSSRPKAGEKTRDRSDRSNRRSMSQPPASTRAYGADMSTSRSPREAKAYGPLDPRADAMTVAESSRSRKKRNRASGNANRREEYRSGYLTADAEPHIPIRTGAISGESHRKQRPTPVDATAREREGFGIPNSLSFLGNNGPDTSQPSQLRSQTAYLGNLPCPESDTSTLGGSAWQEHSGPTDTLSRGAEALFKELSGHAANTVEDRGTRKQRRRGMTVDGPSAAVPERHPHPEPHHGRIRHSRSQSDTSSVPSVYEEHPTPPQEQHEQHPNDDNAFYAEVEGWKSTMGPEAYSKLLEHYGVGEMRRQNAIYEFFGAEDTFTSQLRLTLRQFIRPLRHKDSKTWIPGVPAPVARLFDWLDDIINLHLGVAIAIKTARRTWREGGAIVRLTDIFVGFTPRLEIYQPYLVRVKAVIGIIAQCVRDSSEFGEFVKLREQDLECGGWTLAQLLYEPVKHLASYSDTFLRILQLTPRGHNDHLPMLSLYHSSKMAMRVMDEVRKRENAYDFFKQTLSDIDGLPPSVRLANRERRLLWQGPLVVCVVEESCDAGEDVRTGTRRGTPKIVIEHFSEGGQRSVGKSTQQRTLTEEPRQVQGYILNDLVLLATPAKPGRRREGRPWRLLENVGIAKLLGVNEISSATSVDLLPITMSESLPYDQPENAVTCLQVDVPRTEQFDEILNALQKCYAETLRSLSFPATSDHGLPFGPTDLEYDTQQSVAAIRSAGLPMPKSPSVQVQDLRTGAAGSAVDQEREERGWWSLRFQQVLGEMRRQDPISLNLTPSLVQ
ncbi:hypothetical protein EIP91_003718 [Steccherinum ochraceum]|uniref:DH domain-containing protein n=1 Tax=Steccherinum ochraceum TaxID=92696 RepID=A0A4R0RRE2_9APHY|nr:hypothetical protein EIP91_003718 [Steccherinum ochraceum]